MRTAKMQSISLRSFAIGDLHEFRQISVNVSLEGDFETAHTIGDNAKILPTDTQKNTVYALAKNILHHPLKHLGLSYRIIFFLTIRRYLTRKLRLPNIAGLV
jgi:urate oxidase